MPEARPIGRQAVAPLHVPTFDYTNSSASALRYAGFGARVCAAVIDFVILQVISLVIDGLFAGAVLSNMNTGTILAATFGPLVFGSVVGLIYSVWLESSTWQATPGKALLGLKVVDVNGERITFRKSSMRNLAKSLSMLTLGIGYLMPLWNKRRQTLHDTATGCLVVYAN